ncbi:LAFA_0D14774g1_1 [Lachancea sp. 'fantastica']|nr:LAFA_0D14774g1_1 [Lachancea sp. 'fantastica']
MAEDEQRPHTGLKGAKITEDIQELMSFSDANKTIGGYIQDDQTTVAIHSERAKLPRFSSTIKPIDDGESTDSAEDVEAVETDVDEQEKAQNVDDTEANEANEANGSRQSVDHHQLNQKEDINVSQKKSATEEEGRNDDEDDDDDDDDDDDFFCGDYAPSSRSVDSSISHRPVIIQKIQDNSSAMSSPTVALKPQNTSYTSERDEIVIDSSEGDQSEREEENASNPTKRISSSAKDDRVSVKRPRNTRTKNNYQKQTATSSAANQDEDEDEQFFKELAREAGRSASTAEKSPSLPLNRVFNIKFTSLLQGTVDKKVNAKVKGSHTFTQILPLALKLLLKEHNVSNELRHHYQSDNVSVYRGGVKILDFMTCNSLQVSTDPDLDIIEVSLTLISKASEDEYRANLEKKNHSDAALMASDEAIDDNDISYISGDDDPFNSQFSESSHIHILDDDSPTENSTSTIRIVLMGKNNEKTYVNVHQNTSMEVLNNHFRSVHHVPEKCSVKLYFDNEELASSQSVGELELEDEDIIEVRLI